MQRHPDSPSRGPEHPPPSAARLEVEQLLSRAAAAAAAAGLDLEAFMTSAWTALMDAQPELRRRLEHDAMVARLELLRTRGQLGQA